MLKKKMTEDEIKRQIPNWRDRDAELVTGVFKNYEAPGQSTSFNYKAYPGDEFKTWAFDDGEKYSIPRGVARHLNVECFVRTYAHLPNEVGQFGVRKAADGSPRDGNSMMAMKKVHRYGFLSLEFEEDELDMIPSDIIEVTKSFSGKNIKAS